MHITLWTYGIGCFAAGFIGRTWGYYRARRQYTRMLQRQARYTVWPDDHQDAEWRISDHSDN